MAQVPLQTLGGLVASMKPSEIPEGASPRCIDVDFVGGRVLQRPGEQNAFNYVDSMLGPSGGGYAVSQVVKGVPWNSPSNVLSNSGIYANLQLINALNVSSIYAFNVTFGPIGHKVQTWYAVVTFTANPPAWYNGQTISFAGQTHYTAFNGQTLYTSDPTTTGFGIPPIAANQAFFQFGTTPIPIQPNTADTGTGTVYGTTVFSDLLIVTQFGFTVPTGATIQGIQVTIEGFCSVQNTNLSIQLVKSGVPVGDYALDYMPKNVAPLGYGDDNSLFGTSWSADDINNINFGVSIQASNTPTPGFPVYVYVGYVTITVYYIPSAANFNYFGQFLAPTGISYKLALDTNGSWWFENTTINPGTLSLVLAGGAINSYGSGATVYDRAFVAMSNLTGQVTGSDIPRQYNFEGGWWDRITQVGPAIAPNVLAAQATGPIATITSISLSGTVATITATNTLVAGEVGTFSGVTGGSATGMNGQTLIVLSTGLSGSQFEVAFAGAAGGPYTQSGATFTPQYVYPVSTITQPAANSDPTDAGHLSVLLWSSGPGSTSAGNTLTVYYAPSYASGSPQPSYQDAKLVAAFNAGYPVYVYISLAPFGNGIYQVTSIGNALPPGVSHYRYYFTVQLATSNYQQTTEPAGQYQITQATVTTSSPVPGLSPGAQVSIAGASVPAWDGVYNVVEAINAGAYNITQTALTGGTATYTWTLVSGAAPSAGQLVSVSGTLNANGILNVAEAVIATASGSTSGTFTITGFASNLTYPTAVEQGQATTAGTQFVVDPGSANVGSTTVNPIYGNSTGGTITIVGSPGGGTLPIGAGTRQAVWIYVTRNGTWTAAGPPTTFTVANDSNYLQVNQAPIGPPNVTARILALTEAGAGGVPGANFYTTTVPTLFTVNGVQYTSSSFLIPDNITTTAKFTFSDQVLLKGDAIDVVGNNLFNLIEIGNPAVILQYAERTFYIGCQNKIQNFINMSFDGGYLATSGGASPSPGGWTVDQTYNYAYEGQPVTTAVSLRVSPVFGNSLYIVNHTGSQKGITGMVTQSAYQDVYNEPILNPAGQPIAYSVRFTARCPGGQQSGALVIDLCDSNAGNYGNIYGQLVVGMAALSTEMQNFSGVLVPQPGLPTIPFGLVLRIWGELFNDGTDVEIDRIEIFPTNEPVLTNQIWVSYTQEPEQVDISTGQLTLNSQNQNPVYGATIIHDQLCFKKSTSMIECEDAANYEPAFWTTREISQAGSGACGPNAFSQGADWDLALHQTGIYLYQGGQPGPVSRELQGLPLGDQFWDTINWNAQQTFWLVNDLRARRFYVGVAMDTPNFWLPNADSLVNPTQPNVVLMCNYEGCPTAAELEMSAPVHVTMFGSVKALDLRRKWSVQQIPSPFSAIVTDGVYGFDTMFIGNGTSSGKIYRLLTSAQQMSDDGSPVQPLYTTSGLPGSEKALTLGLGNGQKYAFKWMANLEGVTAANQLSVIHYQNILPPVWSSLVPYAAGAVVSYGGSLWLAVQPLRSIQPASPNWVASSLAVQAAYLPPLTPGMSNNTEWRAEVRGQRIFTEFSLNQYSAQQIGYFELGEMMVEMSPHAWGSFRGVSQ